MSQFQLAALRLLQIYFDDDWSMRESKHNAGQLSLRPPSPISEKWLAWFLPRWNIHRSLPAEVYPTLINAVENNRGRIKTMQAANRADLVAIHANLVSQFPSHDRFEAAPSAASKLIWAINPDAGVIYDNQAAWGMKTALQKHGLALSSNRKYRTTVNAANYDQFVEAWYLLWNDAGVQRQIGDALSWLQQPFPQWQPSVAFRRRVLDQYLVIAGQPSYDPRNWVI